MPKIQFSLFPFLLLSFHFLPAQPKYEFRGVWIATVDNIDWPSNKFLSTDSQKIEFIHLLDMHQKNGMNAVIVQIRAAADAFYPSPFEPWSEWLSGKQGIPPGVYYDPLEFMIKQTHERGMEFHAWINPYRAVFNVGTSSIAPLHITKLHPDWFLTYGDKKYFDPGNKEVQKFLNSIVRDVVSRYDIDAIHFDDYFYPYRIEGKEFPDNSSYSKYGYGLSKNDWRRSNVDSIIVMLGKTIKQEKEFCKFGISPFGVWRNIDKDPQGSNTRAGQTNYDDLYADILLWLKMKWIDYVAPQLYWDFSQKTVPFATLLDWWARHSYGRSLYIGHGIYRVFEPKSAAWRNKKELPNQIKELRNYRQVQGSIYFSSKTFTKNPNGWNDTLQNNYYKYPALVPPMPWLSSALPLMPEVFPDTSLGNTFTDTIKILVNYKGLSTAINRYILYSFTDSSQINTSDPKKIVAVFSSANKKVTYSLPPVSSGQKQVIISLTSVNRFNNESSLSNYITLEKQENAWVWLR